jgi:MFS family permease
MPKNQKNSPQNQKKLIILYFLGLFLAISNALPAYIQSNFLKQFVSLQRVGLFFIIANLLSVLSILIFPSLIEKLNNYFLTKIVLVLYAASLLGLVLAGTAEVALISTILFTVTSNLIWINMDIMVENFSANRLTGRIRTIYFTFINVGWILSPFFTTYLIGKGEYTLSFLVAAAFVVPFFFILISQNKKLSDHIVYQREPLIQTIKKTWKHKNLRSIFFIAFLLQLFYSSAVIYIPIYLFQNLGMSWNVLGPIFSIMLIPFILVEIPAGILADKYIGEKEMLFVGFFILIISLLSFYFIKTPSFWLWLIALFASRVGAALVESMKETYFFKVVGVKEVGCINIFRTAGPLAYVAGPIIAILTLMYLPLNYLFLILSIIMLAGLGFTAALKDTK